MNYKQASSFPERENMIRWRHSNLTSIIFIQQTTQWRKLIFLFPLKTKYPQVYKQFASLSIAMLKRFLVFICVMTISLWILENTLQVKMNFHFKISIHRLRNPSLLSHIQSMFLLKILVDKSWEEKLIMLEEQMHFFTCQNALEILKTQIYSIRISRSLDSCNFFHWVDFSYTL